MPIYNAAPYLNEALESVYAQQGVLFEVIAVDDGSTDTSGEIARSFSEQGIRYVQQHHQGTAAALNFGISLAQGELITFIDADDLWTEDRLARQAQLLLENQHLDFVLGYMQPFLSPELSEIERAQVRCDATAIAGYLLGTCMARKRAFEVVGLFSATWKLGEFLDWYLRAQECKLRHYCSNDLVLRRRIHRTNKGRVLKECQIDYLAIIRESLGRRKIANQSRLVPQ